MAEGVDKSLEEFANLIVKSPDTELRNSMSYIIEVSQNFLDCKEVEKRKIGAKSKYACKREEDILRISFSQTFCPKEYEELTNCYEENKEKFTESPSANRLLFQTNCKAQNEKLEHCFNDQMKYFKDLIETIDSMEKGVQKK